MKRKFIDIIENNDFEGLKCLGKTDLHSHAGRGGHQDYISAWSGQRIQPVRESFTDLNQMQDWFEKNIKSICPGHQGYMKRLEAAFVQAKHDHIVTLALGFGMGEIDRLGGIDNFIQVVSHMAQVFAPETTFLPELSIGRQEDGVKVYHQLDEILEKNFFRSIDICNNEFAQPIKVFKKAYEKAEAYGLRKIAHVGEFGTADDVWEAVETLHLDEVHHGIAAAKSNQVMRFLNDHRIQLNICPSSNLLLSRISSYGDHPIKALFNQGVPVTINTDDLLIFNSSITEEYMHLYKHKVLSSNDLYEVWQQGLKRC